MPSSPTESSPWVAGADGYRNGWIVVLRQPSTDTIRRRPVVDVDELLCLPEAPAVLEVSERVWGDLMELVRGIVRAAG
ncbi:MAG: hypothetical protein BRD30_08070 [Bacteroidetes bacterium QH_2_63_10]|nr:MAG: hypothetical protein BRD30_08070 [Bacteroidetes bacterium QH_2_63_10]